MSWMIPLFILALPAFASAQDTLETIEVTNSKAPSVFTFTDYETFEDENFDHAPLNSVTGALDQVSGLYVTQNGGPGGSTSFFLRGTESSHVAFVYDGIKLNDPSNPSRQFNAAFLQTPDIEKIEVYKGPQPVLFGSDAIGGLVYLHSRKGSDIPKTSLYLGGGSFGTAQAYLSTDWKGLNGQGTLTIGHFHTDGISSLNEKRYGYTRRNSVDTSMITSSSKHIWNPKIDTDILFKFVKGKASLDDAFTPENSLDESEDYLYLIQQKSSYGFNQNCSINLRTSFTRHNRIIQMLSMGNEAYEGELTQSEIYYKTKSRHYEILAGFSSEIEALEQSGLDKNVFLHSAYLQTLFKFKRWEIQAGLREDYHELYHDFNSFSSGIKYIWNSRLLKLQYSQGYKAPSLYQLYGNFGGNEDLTPEKNNAWEFGFEGKESWGSWELVLFENQISNLITFVSTGAFSGTNINQEEFTVRGAEVAGDFLLNERWKVRPSFTHQKFLQNDERVLRRPQNMAALRTMFFPKDNVELYGHVKWIDSRYDRNFPIVVKLNPYEVINVGASYTFSNKKVGLHVLNLANRGYEDIYGFSVMPLSVFVDYKVEFY